MTFTLLFTCSSATLLLVWLTSVLSGWKMRFWDDEDWIKAFVLSIFFPVGIMVCISTIIPMITEKIFNRKGD